MTRKKNNWIKAEVISKEAIGALYRFVLANQAGSTRSRAACAGNSAAIIVPTNHAPATAMITLTLTNIRAHSPTPFPKICANEGSFNWASWLCGIKPKERMQIITFRNKQMI